VQGDQGQASIICHIKERQIKDRPPFSATTEPHPHHTRAFCIPDTMTCAPPPNACAPACVSECLSVRVWFE
jgi:hypothetical protein